MVLQREPAWVFPGHIFLLIPHKFWWEQRRYGKDQQLVFSLVFILRKKGTALGLIIASSATTAFSLTFIWLSDYAISFVTTTFVPVLMLILSVANIIFYIISRKAGK